MNTRLALDHDGIYDVLVEECGAPEGQDRRENFARVWPGCIEYRFGGDLGFGGKIYWSHGELYVNCYQENRTPERAAMIDRANVRLATFVKSIER